MNQIQYEYLRGEMERGRTNTVSRTLIEICYTQQNQINRLASELHDTNRRIDQSIRERDRETVDTENPASPQPDRYEGDAGTEYRTTKQDKTTGGENREPESAGAPLICILERINWMTKLRTNLRKYEGIEDFTFRLLNELNRRDMEDHVRICQRD